MATTLGPRLADEQEACVDLSGKVEKIELRYFAYGGFSEVYRGRCKDHSVHSGRVAIKVLRGIHIDSTLLEVTTRRLNRETKVWNPLSHKNILPFLGVCYDVDHSPALISPLCDLGNVRDYLKAKPRANRLILAREVAEGLKYLHSVGVVHGDMKPHNVLIDDNGVARLCDFGRSRIVARRGFTTELSGTLRWMAPELFVVPPGIGNSDADESVKSLSTDLTTQTDIYGFAMVVLEVITGKQPFPHIGHDVMVIYVVKMGQRPQAEQHNSPNPKMWAILQNCWDQEPKLRPDMSVVVQRLAEL